MQASAEQEFKGARPADETIARAYKFADLSSYPRKKRFLIRAADLAFFLLIKVIGRTIRWQVEGWENWEAATREARVPIYTLWHNRVFLATYFWQKRRIVAMTSQSFDGEYIARFMQRFGYGAARGSSTRGAVGAIIVFRFVEHSPIHWGIVGLAAGVMGCLAALFGRKFWDTAVSMWP